jgi:hypothetical protein
VSERALADLGAWMAVDSGEQPVIAGNEADARCE